MLVSGGDVVEEVQRLTNLVKVVHSSKEGAVSVLLPVNVSQVGQEPKVAECKSEVYITNIMIFYCHVVI